MSEEKPIQEMEEPQELKILESRYANNVRLEPSVWDLKLLFGQLELHTGKPKIDWHTAMTMPWMQAKILSYYLLANIALHESVNGRLAIPDNVKPPKPEFPPADTMDKDPVARDTYEILAKLYAQIFS